jgi:hypothetical protein
MAIRYVLKYLTIQRMFTDPEYVAWHATQKQKTKEAGDAAAKKIAFDDAHMKDVKLTIKVLQPALLTLRLADGKKGASLGQLYGDLLRLDHFYRNEIEGLDGSIREKVHKLFMLRWQYFHNNIMTAAYRFTPQYMHQYITNRDTPPKDNTEEAATKKYFKVFFRKPSELNAFLLEITDFEESLSKGAGMLNAQFAFSDLAKQQPLHRWAATYLSEWPILCDFVKRLHSVPCSASACEHAWSIQGWFTSKRRNRLRETVLQRLMRMHANLLMLDRLNQLTFKDGPLAGQAVVPWDLECEIPEPYEGCEGGESDEEDDSD